MEPPAVFQGQKTLQLLLVHPEVGKHKTDISMTVFLKSSLKEINDFLQQALSNLGLGIDRFIYSELALHFSSGAIYNAISFNV